MPTVRFRFLDKPKEDQFSIKLSKLHTYDDIVTRVAQRLGLNDPSKIRLTSHDCYSQGPKPQPIMYRGVEHLSDMLESQIFCILYYEVLDIPLPELQCLKALKIAFHHATRDEARLKKEQEENEQKRKEKAEAHLYTTIKVTWDEDLFEQIGKDIFFDLVDHDKVRSFRVKKQMQFTKFKSVANSGLDPYSVSEIEVVLLAQEVRLEKSKKASLFDALPVDLAQCFGPSRTSKELPQTLDLEEVARVFGIPVLYQRFWLWAKRQNFTYRPDRPLTPEEETQPIGQLREVANKTNQTELKLFLELEIGQDFRPIPPLEKTKEDLLLFFKLYDPSDEKLRYVGRFYVTASGKPLDIISGLKQMAGFAMNEEIELFEEIKFEPSVMCECVDLESTFQASQLEDGDIICYQKTFKAGNSEQFRYPDVRSFLEYVHNRVVLRIRFLEKPKEDQFSIELSKLHTYDDVVIRVSQHLCLNDPSKIRLTSHDWYSQQPKAQPITYRGGEHLSDMLVKQTSDILYYEVLDFPLSELQCLNTFKFSYRHATRDAARLTKEQEKVQKRKEKAEAHLYTIIKVTWDEDLFEQIGKHIFFDLVDHDKVRSFRVKKQMPFPAFKEEVARVFGIPVLYQRFWLWAKRQNVTYRPHRPLTPQEEAQPIGELREVSNKANNAEMKLFLELEIGLDFRPIPPLEKTEEDLLLFFKLYDPSDEKLRYVGRFYVTASGKPLDILSALKQMAGFAMNEEIELFEEIKFEPSVMCERVDLESTFRASQLEDGDIICYQKSPKVEFGKQFRYPDVPSFFNRVL